MQEPVEHGGRQHRIIELALRLKEVCMFIDNLFWRKEATHSFYNYVEQLAGRNQFLLRQTNNVALSRMLLGGTGRNFH